MTWRTMALVAILAVLPAAALQTDVPGYRVAGTVENSHGNAVSSAAVLLTTVSGSELGSQLTKARGAFAFSVPQPGPYELVVATEEGMQRFAAAGDAASLRLRMHRPAPASASTRRGAGAAVSVNDLQASARAKSTLRAAEKALEKSDDARAWKLANKAIQQAPGWSRTYTLRGGISFNRHNYAAARSDLDRALARNSQNTEALTLLGRLEFLIGDTARAGRHLEEALRLPPVNWMTYLDMADVELRLHRAVQARGLAEKALQGGPHAAAAAHFLMAEADYQMGKYEPAKWDLEVYVAELTDTPANAAERTAALHNLQELQRRGLVH